MLGLRIRMQHLPISYPSAQPILAMTLALLVGSAICSSVAIPLGGMLIYHDLNDKASYSSWERALAALLEACQMGLSGAGMLALVAARAESSEMHWYDTVVLCSLQLSVGNNVGQPLFSSRPR